MLEIGKPGTDFLRMEEAVLHQIFAAERWVDAKIIPPSHAGHHVARDMAAFHYRRSRELMGIEPSTARFPDTAPWAEVGRLEALCERLRETIAWAADTLIEINTSNYDHDDVCRQNDASVEVMLTLDALIKSKEPTDG